MAETVSVRLNHEEREALKRAAAARGLGISTFARRVLREAIGLEDTGAADEWRESIDRRLSRLEEMAGL